MMAWVMYGMTYVKRMPEDRLRAKNVLKGLLLKLLVNMNRGMNLLCQTAGSLQWKETTISPEGRIPVEVCYSPEILVAIRHKWEEFRLRGYLESRLDESLLLVDVVAFALHPQNNTAAAAVKPSALSLLAQLTKQWDVSTKVISHSTTSYTEFAPEEPG